jgi:antirestriction protein ArdC
MGKQKKLYKKVTKQVIDSLKDLRDNEDNSDWQPPWAMSSGMPRNGSSGHVYSGVNVMVLLMQPYTCNRWYTYKQALDENEDSHVKKGESGTTVCYFNFQEVEKRQHEKTDKEKRKEEQNDDFTATKTIPFLRTYTVFNEDQCANIDKSTDQDTDDLDPVESCEAMIPEFELREGQPSYSSKGDFIRMPKMGKFEDSVSYYKTLFHELGHWTGHESRLNRDLGNRFGSEAYAFEELIAEMTALFLSSEAGVEPQMKNSAKYLDHWIEKLEEDPYAIFTVSREAKEAAGHIKEASGFEQYDDETEKAA